MRIKFEDIHGIDWRFVSPDGKEQIIFSIAGYGIYAKAADSEKQEARRFEDDHPDWKKEIEKF